MTFKNWKKRSSLFVGAWAGNEHLYRRIERACAAAYKAGAQSQRDATKMYLSQGDDPRTIHQTLNKR